MAAALVCNGIAIAASPIVSFDTSTPGKLPILVDGKQIAVYEYNGEKIPRPYFAHVQAPGGIQVTRHHPPIAGKDPLDHDTFHPGIWMSFGDLSANDYWRNLAKVQTELLVTPHGGAGKGSFTVWNRYLDQQHPKVVVCDELCRVRIIVDPASYLIVWESIFSADQKISFGDQEEMGIGFRTATDLRAARSTNVGLVAGSGLIRDADGRQGEKEVWGESAVWCDYSGMLDGKQVGITLMCHPDNFRPSWFHARDYGLLVANPFGRATFGKSETGKLTVGTDESLRLRYGVMIHSSPRDDPIDLNSAYAKYVLSAGD